MARVSSFGLTPVAGVSLRTDHAERLQDVEPGLLHAGALKQRNLPFDAEAIIIDGSMITGPQMKAARALLGIDQKELARRSSVSLPTIQRMEACEGSVKATVDSLEKVVNALNDSGVELIGTGARSDGAGRGVRLIERK